MNEHERATCEAIEVMLFAATGRRPTGGVDDILFRIICNSEFATMAGYPSDGLGTEDAKKLANALWCVISSIQVDDPLMIVSTIPRISGESSRFDFAEMWASELAHGTPVPDVNEPDIHGGRWTQTDVRKNFEEYLVSVVVYYCERDVCNEFFGFRLIFPKMNDFCRALGDPARISKVSECLLNVMTIVEDRYGV